jgi:hypothetical protein
MTAKQLSPNQLPWHDKVALFAINPAQATAGDIARMAAELLELSSTRACLPPHFPINEKEAIAFAMKVGCPDQFVIELWNAAMSRGGLDGTGQPITSWQHYVAKRFAATRSMPQNACNGNVAQSRAIPETLWEKIVRNEIRQIHRHD